MEGISDLAPLGNKRMHARASSCVRCSCTVVRLGNKVRAEIVFALDIFCNFDLCYKGCSTMCNPPNFTWQQENVRCTSVQSRLEERSLSDKSRLQDTGLSCASRGCNAPCSWQLKSTRLKMHKVSPLGNSKRRKRGHETCRSLAKTASGSL